MCLGRGGLVVASLLLLLGPLSCLRSLPDIPSSPNGVTVAGRVVERDVISGDLVAVAGVRVAVAGTGASVRSADDGRFELPSLPLGPMRLVFLRPATGRDPITLKVVGGLFGRVDGERLFLGDVDVRDPGTLRGEVVVAGAPEPRLAEGTLVAVAETAYRAVVDERGEYVLARLPEGGTFDVVAFRSGYAPARLRGVSVLANAALELSPLVLEAAGPETSRRVEGRARLEGRANAGHAGITLSCASETSSTAAPVSATTSDAGDVSLLLPFGLYRCEASHPAASPLRLAGVAVLPEGVIGLPALRLALLGDPATADLDGDGVVDANDPDRDGDGFANGMDVAPDDPEVAVDTDGDGVGDALDLDDDGDTLSDAEEVSRGRDGFLTDPLRVDTDGDGASDARDVCPATPDPDQLDSDGDGRGDACSTPDEEVPVEVQLQVTGFTPARAGAGVSITLRGQGFDRVARSNVVTFGGEILAQASARTDDRLTVVVPPGAQSGPVAVYNGRTVVTSTGVLQIVPAPVLIDFTPVAAAVGQAVVVTGRGMGAARVFLGTSEASVVSATAERIEFLVPPLTADTYPIEVRAEGGVARTGLPLQVLGDARINTLVPAVAGRGQLLRILGSGLVGAPGEVVEVEFVGAAMRVAPTLATSGELRVEIPADAQSGPVTVHRGAARIVSGTTLTIDGNLATIRSIDPWLAMPGETVRLSGDNFTRVTAVRVAGVVVPHVIESATSLRFDVPVGLRAGRVTVESQNAAMETVTSTSPEGLSVVRLVGQRVLRVLSLEAMALDPTRDVLYAGARGQGIGGLGLTLDLPGLVATSTVPTPAGFDDFDAISSDGRFVSAHTTSQPISVWSTTTWLRYDCQTAGAYWTLFSPDGRSVFAGDRDGLWHIDLTQAVPVCRRFSSGPAGRSALHTDSSRQLLTEAASTSLRFVDVDPTSTSFGQESRPRWDTPSAVPRMWSPPSRGRISGDVPGGAIWVPGSGNGIDEVVPLSNQAALPATAPSFAQFEPLTRNQTRDRRWTVTAPNTGQVALVVLDLASARGRLLPLPIESSVYTAGGPRNFIAVWLGNTSELRLYEIDAAALE